MWGIEVWGKEEEEKLMKKEEKMEEEEEEWLVGRCRPVEAWPAANWPCNALMLLDPPAPLPYTTLLLQWHF